MISKTCGYAIRGVVYLAVKSDDNRKIGIHEIAENLNVPQHFMSKVLQDLARKGIILSIKGPNGGFFVNKSTLNMPLITIVEAIDGLGVLKKCYLGRDECSSVNPCPLHEHFDECRINIFEIFRTKKVEDLMNEVRQGTVHLNNCI